MNSDYPLQETLGRTRRGLRLTLLLTTAVGRRLETWRTRLPASHAGVADVSSTPEQLLTVVWSPMIIESLLGAVKPLRSCHETPPWNPRLEILRTSSLESRSHRETERLTRLPQQEGRRVGGLCQVESVVA